MNRMTAKALESQKVAEIPKRFQATPGQHQILPPRRRVQMTKIARMIVVAVVMKEVRVAKRAPAA